MGVTAPPPRRAAPAELIEAFTFESSTHEGFPVKTPLDELTLCHNTAFQLAPIEGSPTVFLSVEVFSLVAEGHADIEVITPH